MEGSFSTLSNLIFASRIVWFKLDKQSQNPGHLTGKNLPCGEVRDIDSFARSAGAFETAQHDQLTGTVHDMKIEEKLAKTENVSLTGSGQCSFTKQRLS